MEIKRGISFQAGIPFCSLFFMGLKKGERRLQNKKCLFCGEVFYNNRKSLSNKGFQKQLFCSPICRNKYRVKDYIRIIKSCLICNKVFSLKYRKQTKRFCSIKCFGLSKAEPRLKKSCAICGKIFFVWKSLEIQKHCSRKCSYATNGEKISLTKKILFQQGKLVCWRKGISKYNSPEERKQAILASGRRSYQKHIERKRFYYRQLNYKRRNAIGHHSKQEWEDLKNKYNYSCPDCKRKEPEIKLTVDHIQPISKGGSNDIENIQPLCLKCNLKKGTKIIKFSLPTLQERRLESLELWKNNLTEFLDLIK